MGIEHDVSICEGNIRDIKDRLETIEEAINELQIQLSGDKKAAE